MRNIDLILLTLIASVVGNASPAYAQITQNDSLAIIESSLNYVEGWYEGDAERMKRGLHPDLAKRSVYTHPKSGRSIIRHIGASSLVEITRAGGGKESREKHIKNGSQVIILDVFQNIATV